MSENQYKALSAVCLSVTGGAKSPTRPKYTQKKLNLWPLSVWGWCGPFNVFGVW